MEVAADPREKEKEEEEEEEEEKEKERHEPGKEEGHINIGIAKEREEALRNALSRSRQSAMHWRQEAHRQRLSAIPTVSAHDFDPSSNDGEAKSCAAELESISLQLRSRQASRRVVDLSMDGIDPRHQLQATKLGDAQLFATFVKANERAHEVLSTQRPFAYRAPNFGHRLYRQQTTSSSTSSSKGKKRVLGRAWSSSAARNFGHVQATIPPVHVNEESLKKLIAEILNPPALFDNDKHRQDVWES